MKIHLVSVEDALTALGFRKMSALIKSINPDTHSFYVPLNRRTSMWNILTATQHEKNADSYAAEVARGIADADIIGFTSMSDYAGFVKQVIEEVRRLNPSAYIMWGGVHPIIVPEDAITHADAVCTGEGEFAFQQFFDKFRNGQDFTSTGNFWFNHEGVVIKNPFLPLMSNEEMSEMPILEYASGQEMIFERNRGFVPMTRGHYLEFDNLAYNTIWSIGCPFRCTYCGNTKFIANDNKYRRLRHPSVEYLMAEIEQAVSRHPHISSVMFHDDSFMALPYRVLEEFAEQYAKRIARPFHVYGVIPNYVKTEKMAILTEAGMNRVRMGIQSGSARILEFYKRPSPPERVMKATQDIGEFTPYMLPPVYDIIVDNPIETKQDIDDTLRLVYEMPRPFRLNLFSLRVMPNTDMAKQFEELNVRPEDIAEGYYQLAPTLANGLLYVLGTFRPPRAVFEWWIKKAQPYHVEQREYGPLNQLLRAMYFFRVGIDQLRNMDFTHLPGKVGFVLYKLGVIKFWKRYLVKKYTPRERAPVEPRSLQETRPAS